MNVGDLFFACSDGITEAGDHRHMFGEDRVKEVVMGHRTAALRDIAHALLQDCSAFGGPPADDRSILVARVEADGGGSKQ